MSRIFILMFCFHASAQTVYLKNTLYAQKNDDGGKVQILSLKYSNDNYTLLSRNTFLSHEIKGNLKTILHLNNTNEIKKYTFEPPKRKLKDDQAKFKSPFINLKRYEYGFVPLKIGKLYEPNENNGSFRNIQYNVQFRTYNDLVLHRERRSMNSITGLCSLSIEKLLEVKNEVKSAFSQIVEQTLTCELVEASSDNCINWLNLMQCATEHITKEIKKAVLRNTSTKWEDVYKKIKFKYEQGEFIKNSLPTDLQTSFDALRTELQGIERVLNDIKSAFKEEQINLCIEDIRNGNIDDAVSHFKQLKSNSVLIEITRVYYNKHGKLQNLKNIVNFGNALPTCSQNLILYISLYELVKSSDGLNSPYVVLFNKGMDRCMKNTSIAMTLGEKTEEIFKSWADSIRNSDYNNLLPFLKENAILIRDYYPHILEKVYASNIDNAKIALNFIRDTPFIEDESVCLMALYDIMKSNGDLTSYQTLMLAYRVKELMEMQNYPTIRENLRDKMEVLKNSFHNSVRGLIWDGSSCTVKSKTYKEYLYAANDDWAYDSDRRSIFTWRLKQEIIQGYWKIIPVHNGEYFNLKNTVHNEYLYAAADPLKHAKDRRNVFTWRPGTNVIQDQWKLEPEDNGDYFAILSKTFSEYLYSPSDKWAKDSDRRRVFTWGGEDQYKHDSMLWEINC